MKKFITNLYGQSKSSTAMAGQHMVTEIAKKEGYSEIAIPAFPVTIDSESELRKRIQGMITAVGKSDMVILQMPSWNGIAFDEVFIELLSHRVGKMVIFVHDFVPLMFDNNYYLMSRYLESYNKADLLVLPSDQMGSKLIEDGLRTKYIVQGIWDHLTEIPEFDTPKLLKKINFAGNLTRFPFTKDWKQNVELNVFSDGKETENSEFLKIRGWHRDDLLLRELNQGGFGLVWSENIENQSEREYSKMNASFKFSTYLAAGIPIIVNKELAKQNFVEKYGIGYVADSLEDAANYVKNITNDEYEILLENVKDVGFLVRDGFFSKKLLIEIQENVFLGH